MFCGTVVGKHLCICCGGHRVLGNTAVYVVRLTECWETLLYMLRGSPSAGKHCCICCEAYRVLGNTAVYVVRLTECYKNCAAVIILRHIKARLLALSLCVTCVNTSLFVCFIVRSNEHIFPCVISSLYNDTL